MHVLIHRGPLHSYTVLTDHIYQYLGNEWVSESCMSNYVCICVGYFISCVCFTLQSGQQLGRRPRNKRQTLLLKAEERHVDGDSVHGNSTFNSFISEDLSSAFIRETVTHPEEVQQQNNTTWYTLSSDGSFLSLPLITKQEEGIYSCQVANEAGLAHKTFRLDVLG